LASSIRIALLIVIAFASSGCIVLGPRVIAAGRGAYAEVINRTADEQILNVIVRQRYDETFGMLSVASVTASLRFRAQSGTNIGIGPSEDYAGNLVPFSAGVSYEESPTISYVPLSGADFVQRMLSPVSAREWHLLSGPVKHPGNVLILAARRINGLRNPIPGSEPASPEFQRFIELYDRLRLAGVLDPVEAAEASEGDERFWAIHDYQGVHSQGVRELLELLGIEAKSDGSTMLLPVLHTFGSSTSAIHVSGRSAFDVLEVFGTGVEIPASHLDARVVEPLRSVVPEDRQFITIRSSKDRPDDSTVEIRFRDWWFYIDATDTGSKRSFAFLRTFIGMRLAEKGAAHSAPVLTVPVK